MPATLEARRSHLLHLCKRQFAIYAILERWRFPRPAMNHSCPCRRCDMEGLNSAYYPSRQALPMTRRLQDDRRLKCRRVLRLAKYRLDLSRLVPVGEPYQALRGELQLLKALTAAAEWHRFSRAEAMLDLGASREKPGNVSLSESRQCPLLAPRGGRPNFRKGSQAVIQTETLPSLRRLRPGAGAAACNEQSNGMSGGRRDSAHRIDCRACPRRKASFTKKFFLDPDQIGWSGFQVNATPGWEMQMEPVSFFPENRI